MDDIIQLLIDEYYRQTGECGLWNSGLYTSGFVKWLLTKIKDNKVDLIIKNSSLEVFKNERAQRKNNQNGTLF
jgi:hypothetical protein